jgi:ribose 5-phosphate isomerase A
MQGVPIEVAPFAWAKVFVSTLSHSSPSLPAVTAEILMLVLPADLQKMGCENPTLRMGKMKAGPVVTDNGCVSISSVLPGRRHTDFPSPPFSNFVIDAVFSESYMRDPAELLHRIKMFVPFPPFCSS